MRERLKMQSFKNMNDKNHKNDKNDKNDNGYFDFKKIDETKIHDGRIFTLEEHKYIAPDKKEHTYDIIKHNGAVAIVALLNGKIVLTKQYRPAVEDVVYEIPAGKLELGEQPEECAKREFLEETGLLARNIKKITSFYSAIGFCTEIIHLYYVDEVMNALQQLDEDEFIELYKFSIEELEEMIEKGEIIDAKTILSVYMIKNMMQEGKL